MLRLNFDPLPPPTDPALPLTARVRWPAAIQLALDEAMLVWADQVVHGAVHEAARQPDDRRDLQTESMRVWTFAQPTVVLGRSSRWETEVDHTECRRRGVDVVRRCTGGASVVGGPGCLMYSVVLRLHDDQSLRKVDAAHDHVMQRVLAAVQRQLPMAERRGVCDLTIHGRKFSGNSLRIARHHLLYHGTLLIDADLDAIAACLDFAPRQPEYRDGRDHRDFITNVPLEPNAITRELFSQWNAVTHDTAVQQGILQIARELLAERYLNENWHRRH